MALIQGRQSEVMTSMMSEIFFSAFEIFTSLDINHFRVKLAEELKALRFMKELQRSSKHADSKFAMDMMTPFMKIYVGLELDRATLRTKGYILNKRLIFEFVDHVQVLREKSIDK